jgi:mannose-1-phosphate guanylyltransferase/phosphomannomutase
MTFGKALELVAAAGRPLADVVDELPEFHVARRDVPTPWELKGTVMRELAAADGAKDRRKLVLIDGVKMVDPERWVLVVPYPDEPSCRIWAEAGDPAASEELADRYAELVAEVVRRGDQEKTY